MNTHDALEFLAQHQPMPDHPSEEILTTYRQTTAHFYEFPDERCIPLYIGSFAEWDDWSIYDSILSVLRRFDAEVVCPYLWTGLHSPNLALRLWSADMSRYFPHARLIKPLAPLLRESRSDVRLVAAAALERIGGAEVVVVATEALIAESDEDVKEILLQIVQNG